MGHYLEIGGVNIEKPWKTVDINDGDIKVDLNSGRIDVENSSVDRINCSHLIEHLDYSGSRKFFSEIHRILSDNGIASFVVPNTDSNSWWKGFFEHYDLRMNPFFFRSLSRALDSKLIDKRTMWPDYDGQPFGMLMDYTLENFDFEILGYKVYKTKSYSLLNNEAELHSDLHIYNTIDSTRVFLKKRIKDSEVTSFSYFEELCNQPNYEIRRDLDYILTQIRAYLDFSDCALNDLQILKKIPMYKAYAYFNIFDFLENFEEVYQKLELDFINIKSHIRDQSKFELESIEDALNLCKQRKEMMVHNKEGFLSLPAFISAYSTSSENNNSFFGPVASNNLSDIDLRLHNLEKSWWNRILRKLTNYTKRLL